MFLSCCHETVYKVTWGIHLFSTVNRIWLVLFPPIPCDSIYYLCALSANHAIKLLLHFATLLTIKIIGNLLHKLFHYISPASFRPVLPHLHLPLNLTQLNSSNSPFLLSLLDLPVFLFIVDIIPRGVSVLVLLWASLLSAFEFFLLYSCSICRFGCLNIAIPTRCGMSSRK